MESVLMTTPPDFCASSSAKADLPLAVGPAISTALLHPCEPVCMSLVATLICNPANPALDSTIVDGANALVPSAAAAQGIVSAAGGESPYVTEDAVKSKDSRLRQARGEFPIDIPRSPRG